jgi:hypothetical protein
MSGYSLAAISYYVPGFPPRAEARVDKNINSSVKIEQWPRKGDLQQKMAIGPQPMLRVFHWWLQQIPHVFEEYLGTSYPS